MQNNMGLTALMIAALRDHQKCVFLLKNEMIMKDKDSKTALMIATIHNSKKCLPILMLEIGLKDIDGNTALMWS